MSSHGFSSVFSVLEREMFKLIRFSFMKTVVCISKLLLRVNFFLAWNKIIFWICDQLRVWLKQFAKYIASNILRLGTLSCWMVFKHVCSGQEICLKYLSESLWPGAASFFYVLPHSKCYKVFASAEVTMEYATGLERGFDILDMSAKFFLN